MNFQSFSWQEFVNKHKIMTSDLTYILAIDQSTSATKAMLFNKRGIPEKRVTIQHKQFYPRPDFVEHDPSEIFDNTVLAIQQILRESNVTEEHIKAISITNQRETICLWDKNTGKPVCNAAVWQCQRGEPLCNQLKKEGYSELIKEKTGLIIDPYFSASKLSWIIENTEGIKEKIGKGELLAGTMDSWLLWKLTDGKVHATDYSNACRTMLFNIHTLQWDQELLNLFGIDRQLLPEVHFSDEIFGYTNILLNKTIPVAGIMGDSHAALFGQNCTAPGLAKATYGTGSSIMMNIGTKPLQAPEGLVTSIGFGIDNNIHYVYEGNIHCTGDTINWLKNDLQLIESASETEALATSVGSNNGVYMVPAFVGLGAPYWDNKARAAISGISRNTKKAHIVRAALESICYQVKDLIMLMEQEGTVKLRQLRVDGGPTRNNFLMQFQSDVLKRNVFRTNVEEVSALGSTFMAGLATGLWKSYKEIEDLNTDGELFEPKMEEKKVESLYAGWKNAVIKVLSEER
jgi:glycerol kinase